MGSSSRTALGRQRNDEPKLQTVLFATYVYDQHYWMMSQATRAALFGGSFDPPHQGHMGISRFILTHLGFDEVWWFPTYRHALDKTLSSFEHRLAMCERAVMSLPGAHVSALEKELYAQGSLGRSYFLLEAVLQWQPKRDWSWVVGADVLAEKERWFRWEQLQVMMPMLVFDRHGFDGVESAPDFVPPAVSSSQVRALVHQGVAAEHLVTEDVWHYMAQHKLYR